MNVKCELPSQFSQHKYCTSEKPDIDVWSDEGREVMLVELTVGDESNFEDQVDLKRARYNRELIPGRLNSGWKAQLFTVEIGFRGLLQLLASYLTSSTKLLWSD